MAQAGNFTPILLYSSSTPTNVPSAANLTNSTNGSELAINIADKNLFFKDSTNTINTVPIRQSGTSSNGWLSSTDWNTFNGKAPATSGTSILYGNGSGGFSNVTIGSGITFVGGTLSATGSGGTVTSVTGTSPVVSSGGTTPAISLATAYGDTLNPYASKTANYILAAPNGSAGIPTFRALVTADVTGLGTMATQNANAVAITSGSINGTTIGATTQADITGNTISAFTKFIATDYYAQSATGGNLRTSSGTSLLNWDGGSSGNVTINGGLLANPANKNVSIAPTGTGTATINPATAGTINNMVIGGTTPLAITGTTITATTFVGSGTSLTGVVTSVGATSPVTSTGGQTPTIAMPAATTSVSGYLTSTDWNTFNNKGSGTVTSVTGTAPVVSSGGTAPAISMAAATTSVNGYLTSTDWTTFNGKQTALVSGTNIKTVGGVSLLGSGDVGVIGATYGGTGVNNSSNTITVAGNLTHAGAFTQTFTATGNTSLTLPTSGYLISTVTNMAANPVTGTPSASNFLRGDGTWAVPTAGTGTVTSVAATVPAFLSISGSPITTSGTLAITLSGTALPVANGGTGLTSLTANYIPYGNGASAFNSNSNFSFDGTNLLVGTATAVTSVGSATGKATFNSGLSTTNGTNSTCYTNASGFEGLWFNAGFYRVYNASAVGVYLTSGGTTWVPNVSDERLKNKVNNITNGLDAINKLEPLTFYYKKEKQTGVPRYGFFAQNVGKAIPDAMIVSPEIDAVLGQTYTYDTAIINVYLVKALQELSNKFDAYVASHP